MPTNNDSTLVLEGFLAALLRHHGETSCVDTAPCVDKFIPFFKVNLIFDNCAIHQTKRTTISKRTSRYDSRTMSFKVLPPSPVVEDGPAVPPYRNDGEQPRDTSPPPGAYQDKMSRPHSEEQHGDIPKESLHQSSTRDMMTTSTTYRSCADAANAAAAVHCKSRWSSSSSPPIMPLMREPRNGHHRRFFSADHDLHGRFPTPPHPARRQVSIESDNSTELAAPNASSHHDAIDFVEEESIQHMPGQNKDCNNVIALVDHALHAIGAPISFPDAGQCERRMVPCPGAVMPCHSHFLA